MMRFTGLGQFELPHRRIGIVVELPDEMQSFDDWIGRTVWVDDRRRTILGVERFAHCAPWRKGERVALVFTMMEEWL